MVSTLLTFMIPHVPHFIMNSNPINKISSFFFLVIRSYNVNAVKTKNERAFLKIPKRERLQFNAVQALCQVHAIFYLILMFSLERAVEIYLPWI